jgi:hypothetical protein
MTNINVTKNFGRRGTLFFNKILFFFMKTPFSNIVISSYLITVFVPLLFSFSATKKI